MISGVLFKKSIIYKFLHILIFYIVDAKWLSWGPYTKCSKICGTGEKTRTRKCNPPKHGGKSCSELFKRTVDRDKKLCNETPCKG